MTFLVTLARNNVTGKHPSIAPANAGSQASRVTRVFPRRLRGFASIFGLAAMAVPAVATTPSAEDGFNPAANAQVVASAIQPADGKILIGGYFTTVQSPGNGGFHYRDHLARLLPDGSVDTTFTAGVNGVVTAILLQPDRKIIIGGYFTSLTDSTGTTVTRNHVARLDENGKVDPNFDPNVAGTAPSLVYVATIARDSSGRILIGGEFNTVAPPGTTAPVAAQRIARFNEDGTLDASFTPKFGNVVRAIAIQPNGSIVVGGGFTTVTASGSSTSTARKRIARLTSSGGVDATFDPGADNLVTSLALQLDGKVVAAGTFTSLTPAGGAAVTRSRLARIMPDGSIDATFQAGVNSSVESVAITPDGSIMLSGMFRSAFSTGTSVSTRMDYIARFFSDGTLDTSFYPGPSYLVSTFALQSDGKIFIGGSFTDFVPADSGTFVPRLYMARLNEDGTLDASFNPSVNSRIRVMVEQPSDKSVIIGGSFGSIGGITRHSIARLSATGAVDLGFDPGIEGTVNAIAVQADGKILVGGFFSNVISKGSSDAVSRNYLARFNSDGTLDTSFNPSPNASVASIRVLSDGKILIGGSFTTLRPEGTTEDVAHARIARLNSDGSVDAAYTTNVNNAVTSMEVGSDGKVLIGGSFTLTTVGTVTVATPGLGRLNTDGTVDTTFQPVFNDVVTAVKILSSGKILVGGQFTSVRGTGTTTYTLRPALALLNTDGTLDESFYPYPGGGVDTLALQDDGKILVGGLFTSFFPNASETPVYRNYFARLNADGTVDSSYDPRPNQYVGFVLQQSGGGALISGGFTAFRPEGGTAVQLDTGLARILPNGTLDTAFTPAVNGASGEVRTISYQSDGSIYVGGSFDRFAGSFQTNLIHMRSEGIADFQFRAAPNGAVNALLPRDTEKEPKSIDQRIGWLEKTGRLRSGLNLDPNLQIDGSVNTVARQSTGKIVVGGSFSVSNGSTTINNLARFNADGSLDASFSPGVTGGTIYDVKIRSSDDYILIGGTFTTVGGTTRNGAALLTADGALVTGFDPNVTGTVYTTAFVSDGRIILAGQITKLQPNGSTTSFDVSGIARLTATADVDTSFRPQPNGLVSAVTIQPSDGKVLMGGLFSTLTPNGAATATTRNGIARINTDGTVDTSFDPNLNGQAAIIRIQDDGKIVIGGTFTTITPNGATQAITKVRLARLNTDGTVDTTFDASANAAITSMEIQPADGAIVFGGEFTAVDGVVRNKIARVSSTGVLDSSFNPNAAGGVNDVLLLPNEDIIVGGSFTSLNLGSVLLVGGEFTEVSDADTPYLSLLSADGNPIVVGVPVPNGAVHALAAYADGRVLVGGEFTELDGAAHNRLVRLDTANAIDTMFAPDFSGTAANTAVRAIAVQTDNKAVVGGLFETAGGAAHANLARVNSDGTIDAAFTAGTDGEVRAIALQRDGKILVGGSFTMLAGASQSYLGRLNADGTIDGTFDATVNGEVDSIAIQTDGGVLIGGTFTMAGGQSRSYFAKISGTDGALDSNYDPQPNGLVRTISLTPGGKVLAGGAFTRIGGAARYLVGRLAPSAAVSTSLIVGGDGTSLIWQRTGAAPEIPFANFEISLNGHDWTSLGSGVRDTSIPGWKITGVSSLPAANTYFYARASSLVATSEGASASRLVTVRALYTTSSGGNTGGSNEPPDVPARPSTFLAETYLSANPELANALAGLPDRLDLAWAHYYTHALTSDTEHLYMSGVGESSVDPKLTNLSARAWIGPGEQALIMGVAISDGPVKLLVRALGPSLAAYQIPNPLADPSITVYSGGTVIASNDDWGNEPSVTPAALSEAGATMNSPLDSAMVLILQPGLYTFVVNGNSGTGVGLGELFLLSGGTGRLTNLSARSDVGEGGDILIAGFIRQGVGELLLRGVGPDLAQYEVNNCLADPAITLHKMSTGSTILSNNDWGQIAGAISDKNVRAGAVPFPAGSKDSAAYVVLGTGAYTLHVSGAQPGQKGVALVEVFELR